MCRPVSFSAVAFAILVLLQEIPAWGQRPDFPAVDPPPATAAASEAESPYSLPRSPPLRRPLDPPAPAPERSVYDNQPAPAIGASTAPALDSISREDETGSVAAPQPAETIDPATNTTAADPVNANEAGGTKADVQQAGSTGQPARPEVEISFKLPRFVPKPLRDLWDQIVSVWRYKVFMEVTIEKLLVSLVLLFIGYLAAKRISSWFAARILGRLGIQQNSVATIRTISFYALMAAFTLSTLGALGVPVTIFSYFGGALAVGIGFGSQNIVNNFISGLILLAERPIRVGDTIQVDGLTGKVTEIGARSTRVTTGANMEILVPNSTILQGNVVNWTLTDDLISSKVCVGVAYGSPPREVARLLLLAAEQNADLLKEPAPGVSFTNFGDHALEFELSFWVRLGESSCGKVESDLRFAIDDLFAHHGIIIAYPQRDVHLNLLRPVEVRLTPPAGELRRAAA